AKTGEARPRRALPPARPPAPVRAAGGERDRGPTIVRARAPYDHGVQGCSTAAWLLAPPEGSAGRPPSSSGSRALTSSPSKSYHRIYALTCQSSASQGLGGTR